MVYKSDKYTPETPWELQREKSPDSDTWVVVGYFASTPEQAGYPGFRIVNRTPSAEEKAAASKKRGGR